MLLLEAYISLDPTILSLEHAATMHAWWNAHSFDWCVGKIAADYAVFYEIMTSSAIFGVNVFSGRACSPHQSLQVKHQFWYPTLDAAKCGKTMDGSHQCSISALSKANPLGSSEAVSCRAGSSWPHRTSYPSSETKIRSWGLPAEDSWNLTAQLLVFPVGPRISPVPSWFQPTSRCPWLSPACSQDHCMVWSMNSHATITCFATATNGALTSPRPALSIFHLEDVLTEIRHQLSQFMNRQRIDPRQCYSNGSFTCLFMCISSRTNTIAMFH